VAYPKSPLNEDHLTGLADFVGQSAPKAGDRAPDAKVIALDGTSTTLFQYLYNPDGKSWGWTLLAFDGRDVNAITLLRAACGAVRGWQFVRPRLVLGAAMPTTNDAVALSDLDNEAHAAYGLSSAALVLVRPDGHIAYRGTADRPDKLRAYCEKIFGAVAV